MYYVNKTTFEVESGHLITERDGRWLITTSGLCVSRREDEIFDTREKAEAHIEITKKEVKEKKHVHKAEKYTKEELKEYIEERKNKGK